jgi:chemotaxis protein CheD
MNAIGSTLTIRMAEIAVLTEDVVAKMILGSCIGLSLHDRKKRITAVAHIVLPARLRGERTAGKYADAAIPALLRELVDRGSSLHDITAFVAGGANMFKLAEDRTLATVGELNIESTRHGLREQGIPIEREDVGGGHGRRVFFDNGAGTMRVEAIRPPSEGRLIP